MTEDPGLEKPDSRSPLEQEIRDSFQTRKRVFIGLITGSSVRPLLFSSPCCGYIPFVGLTTIHPVRCPGFSASSPSLLILAIGWAALALVLNILLGRPVLFAKRLRGITVKLFLPLMTLLGRVVGIPKQTVRASFIKVNNELVRGEGHRYPARQASAAHAPLHPEQPLQVPADLRHRQLQALRRMRPRGPAGTCATNTASILPWPRAGPSPGASWSSTGPSSSLPWPASATWPAASRTPIPLPVYGILNSRPFGPCLDTDVALDKVEWAIKEFLGMSTPSARHLAMDILRRTLDQQPGRCRPPWTTC